MSDVEERRRWFSQTLTYGARELREALHVSDDVARVQYLRDAPDARTAFIVAAIDEVTKAAVTMLQVDDLLRDRPSQERDRSVRMIDEALFDELSLRRRKLTEALIASVAFRLTNAEPHYRCYLLLVDLDRHLTLMRDLEIYYGCRPAFIDATLDGIRAAITEHEQLHPEVVNAWYRGHEGERPGAMLAGIASRFKEAITAVNAADVIALGETYGQSYAEASSALHFTPLSWLQAPTATELSGWHSYCGMLGQRVLLAVQDLTGATSPTGGAVAQLRDLDDTNEYPEQLLSSVTRGRANAGDQVLADGCPGIVEEVVSTKYLREAYRVRFTSDLRPVGSGDDNWFPAYWIELVANPGP